MVDFFISITLLLSCFSFKLVNVITKLLKILASGRNNLMESRPTADLSHFCASLDDVDLSATVRERVRYLLLDHLSVTLRGSMLPSSQAIYKMLQAMHASASD